MKLTAELSVYPLREDFKTVVEAFISELLKQEDIVAVTNSMSTQISGEDTAVFAAIDHSFKIFAERIDAQFGSQFHFGRSRKR